MTYIEKESYFHKCAKNLFADWLREAEFKNDYCEFCGFKWRSNYGIFNELKFHETDSPYYFELSNAINSNIEYSQRPKNPLDWFDKSIDRGNILFVPDIVVFHKGSPKYIFEIVHTNPVSEKKKSVIADFFQFDSVEVHVIFTQDILSCTEKPKTIFSRKIMQL